MEKRTPHYNLLAVQAAIAAAGVSCFTLSALRGGHAMGLTSEEMLAAIALLKRGNLSKSMTTMHDHRVWQDVYHAETLMGPAYVKFTLLAVDTTQKIVISFKEL